MTGKGHLDQFHTYDLLHKHSTARNLQVHNLFFAKSRLKLPWSDERETKNEEFYF